MTKPTPWTIAALLALSSAAASGQEGPRAVIACDTLVNLRLLMAEARDDHARALAALPGRPGCRTLARDRVGAAEHRAMVGGAPFECLSVTDEGACLWVMP